MTNIGSGMSLQVDVGSYGISSIWRLDLFHNLNKRLLLKLLELYTYVLTYILTYILSTHCINSILANNC